MNRILVFFAVLSLAGGLCAAQSTLVYEDPQGTLQYGLYANEGQANAVNRIPDFSNAGYRGGGEAIPFVPAVVVVNAPTGGDDTALIQNAINQVAAMPLGADGFRGAVLIQAGDYQVGSTLHVNASGVVIRGEGQQATGGTRITMTATVKDDLFDFRGTGYSPSGSLQVDLVESYVPTGATSFELSSSAGYAPGDRIRVHYRMNETWIADIGMDDIYDPVEERDESWSAAMFQLYYDRTITAIEGNTIHIDAPLVQPVEDQYGGAQIYKLAAHSGLITRVGIESMRLESAYLSDTDEAHGWMAIRMQDVKDAWVRQVTARYFGMGCVYVARNSYNITIEDSAMLDPKSMTTGGRKYSFYLDDSQQVLVQRCFTRGGRHDFVTGSLTPGPNAFVDGLAVNASNDSGPHFRYATGELYDNIRAYQLRVQNRWTSGTGHGWSGAQILFWNSEATDSIVCDAPTGAMNWVIGSKGTKAEGQWVPAEPDGYWESHNIPVTPRSLYYRQLEERLGWDGVRNIIIPEQEAGDIWTELAAWAGEGLFGDDVVAWISEEVILPPANTVRLLGRIRDLRMLDRGASTVWSKLSGPGAVTFANPESLDTSASFSTEGTYVIRLTVDDGETVIAKDLPVRYGNSVPSVDAGSDQSVGAGYSLWTPAKIASAAWYDAADSSTLSTVAGAVSLWGDKSGNGNDLSQGNAGQRPTIGNVSIGGMDAISFRLANQQFLSAPDRPSLDLDSSGGANLFGVFQYHGYVNQGSGLNVVISKGQPLSAEPAYGIRYGSSNALSFKAGTDLQAFSGEDFTGQSLLYGGTRNDAAGTASLHLNGMLKGNDSTTVSISSDNNDPLNLGRDSSGARFADVDFGELILIGGELPDEERQKVEGYLAHKWGLDGLLPGDHLYRMAAPTVFDSTAILNATATDGDGDALTHAWSLVSGPGPVAFGDPSALQTSVEFSAEGIYTLRLTSNDGFTSSHDECIVVVGNTALPTEFVIWSGVVQDTFKEDLNGDGVPDGIAWLLGAESPAVNAISRVPAARENGGQLETRFTMLNQSGRGGTLVELEHSPDLSNWTSVTVPENSGTYDGIDFVITPEGDMNDVELRIPFDPSDTDPRIFIRLRGKVP